MAPIQCQHAGDEDSFYKLVPFRQHKRRWLLVGPESAFEKLGRAKRMSAVGHLLVRHVYEKPTCLWFQAGHEDRALRRTSYAYLKEIRQQNTTGKDLLVFLETESGERHDLFPLICV